MTAVNGKDGNKKNVIFKHDYGQKTLRSLYMSLRDLEMAQLEYLKFKGGNDKIVEDNLNSLTESLNNLRHSLSHVDN